MNKDGSNLRQISHFNYPGYPEYSDVGSVAANAEWSPDGTTLSALNLHFPNYQMWQITFAGACMLAGAGGALLAPVYFVQPDMGAMFSTKAFAASIAGGFGSIPGAIAGGLLLGVIETLTGAYLSQAFRDGIAFVLLIAVLIFRPSGLFRS